MHLPKLKRLKIQAVCLTLFSALLLAPACARRSTSNPAYDAAVKQYDRVRSGMSLSEVVSLLGEPAGKQEGLYRWQATGDSLNNASIEVRFDRAGRITQIARSRSHD